MDKRQEAHIFWITIGTISLGGILMYFAGVKPRSRIAHEIIPVDEPTALDWAEAGGLLFFA